MFDALLTKFCWLLKFLVHVFVLYLEILQKFCRLFYQSVIEADQTFIDNLIKRNNLRIETFRHKILPLDNPAMHFQQPRISFLMFLTLANKHMISFLNFANFELFLIFLNNTKLKFLTILTYWPLWIILYFFTLSFQLWDILVILFCVF